jgi:hypothetical protein
VLIIGLAVELGSLIRTNDLSGRLVADAVLRAGTAKDSADAAVADAGRAKSTASAAEQTAENARIVAANAKLLAHGARQEADSFEKDIVSAKTQAAEAESHLAEALRRAADAAAEMSRFKSPRSLTNRNKLISTLSEFKGTEYTFSAVFPDEESVLLLKNVDGALQSSGWKRGKSFGGFPAIQVFGSDNPYSVPEALNNGIRISVDWPEGLNTRLKALARDNLPSPIRAAAYLNLALSSSISPPEERPEKYPLGVDIQKGDSKVIRISIGKKP